MIKDEKLGLVVSGGREMAVIKVIKVGLILAMKAKSPVSLVQESQDERGEDRSRALLLRCPLGVRSFH